MNDETIKSMQREIDVLRAERDEARARLDSAVMLLTGIHSLLYPEPVKLADGRTMVFRTAEIEANAVLHELSKRIRALPDHMVVWPT